MGFVAGHNSVSVFAQETPLLLLDPETAGSNMVSTRWRACPKKTVATQMEGMPRNVVFRSLAVGNA